MERQFPVATMKNWAMASSLLIKGAILPVHEHVLIGTDHIAIAGSSVAFRWGMEESDAVPTWDPIAIPARDLERIVRVLPENGTVHLSDSGVLRCGRSRFQLPTLLGSEYPEASRQVPASWHSCQFADFDPVFSAVRSTVGIKDARMYLNGVHWVLVDNQLRLESSDGHRATRVEVPVTGSLAIMQEHPADSMDAILPLDPLLAWSKLVAHLKLESFSFSFGSGQFWLQAGPLRMMVSPIGASYPDLQRVLPSAESRPHVLVCKGEELRAALSMADVAVGQDQRILWDIRQQELRVCGRSEDRSAEDNIQVQWNGEDTEISINGRYLRDMVDAFQKLEPEQEDISFFLGESRMDSILVTTDTGKIVVMPIRN